MEFQFDDRGQAGIALAKVRNPARQIFQTLDSKILIFEALFCELSGSHLL